MGKFAADNLAKLSCIPDPMEFWGTGLYAQPGGGCNGVEEDDGKDVPACCAEVRGSPLRHLYDGGD